MTNLMLKSPDESIRYLAQVLECGKGKGRLEVREDRCFRDGVYLHVGGIEAYPSNDEQLDAEGELDQAGFPRLDQAVRLGSYSWTIPDFDEIYREALAAFYPEPKKKASHEDKTRRALEAVMHCAVRCGFVNPTFDAGSVAEMPFVRPTTIVVDTSAVLQGGLDFVIRHLYPMARIKIPAITHMEILNMTERYFAHRRAVRGENLSGSALFDHVTGQGGQRVLLRLELQTDAEIERPRLGADPLRGIIQPESDAEDKSLGLQQIQRSFADRLILETAIQHRDRLSPDHPIVVLTADQGLARMTLGEGLHPLFFVSPPAVEVCGRTLSGTCFRPFIDEISEAPFVHIPLPSLLWELACTFGSARLIADDGAAFNVHAIGDGLSWYPFHSRDDLLWTSVELPVASSPMETDMKLAPDRKGNVSALSLDPRQDPSTQDKAMGSASTPLSGLLKGSYRFSVPAMLQLILAFERKDCVADREGMRTVHLATAKRYADLRNFLLAGGFAQKAAPDGLSKTGRMDELIHTLKTRDLHRLKELLINVPSVNAFLEELVVGRATRPETVKSISQTALRTYVTLAEICCAALEISDEGIYLTPHSPLPSEFAGLALESYRRLKGAEDYVVTGRWLEYLARDYGVHPVRARERLNEARETGLLERYTEGSTPETQYERHNMTTLEVSKGSVTVREVNLYHGDFLIPGKASVSIRLEELRS